MPKICEVMHCKEIGAHQFPADADIRKLWLKAIRRPNFRPGKNSRLCRKHFLDTDYSKSSFYTGVEHQHRFLKKNVIPSVFPWTTKGLSREVQAREERLVARNIKKSLFQVSSQPQPPTSSQESPNLKHCYSHIDVENTHEHQASVPDIGVEISTEGEQIEAGTKECLQHEQKNEVVSTATQTSAILRLFSTELLLNDDDAVKFYTGLETTRKFHLVLQTLLPMAHNLKYRWSQVLGLSVDDQFLMLLIKLRRNKPDFEIAKLFNVSKTEVSNIIVTWIHFVYDLWSLIDIWPDRDLVNFYMPRIFKEQNSKTRVIIDATEVPIDKPSNPVSQRATYSSYKNTNTIKFLVGATPGGLLCYCSQGYGGATSDRQVIERSTLLNLCEEGDSVMADRGFNVQDLFASKSVAVNIPAFLKGKSQLPGIILKKDQKLASQRVHIERLIGLAKTHKILQEPLNSFYVPLASKIFFICIMLCNFREGIVNKNK